MQKETQRRGPLVALGWLARRPMAAEASWQLEIDYFDGLRTPKHQQKMPIFLFVS